MSDSSYWLKLAKLDQGTLGTSLALVNPEKKQPVLFVGILTVSTPCVKGVADDKISQRLQNKITNLTGYRVIIKVKKVVTDDITEIKNVLVNWTESLGLDLILTAGGTGFSPTDVTPEATRAVVEKEAPGFTVGMVAGALKLNPVAMLFRGICGIRRNVIILNLPDNVQASCDLLDTAMPVLPFAIGQLKSDKNYASRTTPAPVARSPQIIPSPTPSKPSHVTTPAHHVTVPSHHVTTPAHHVTVMSAVEDHHAPLPHHAPPASADHHAPTGVDTHHAPGSGIAGLLSENDIDMLTNLDAEDFEEPPERLRVVGTRPSSRGTQADSGISGLGTREQVSDVTRLTRRPRISPYPPATVDKAYSTVLANSNPLPVTTRFFKDAVDHVVAEDVRAACSIPSCATAVVDGYAVIAADMPGDVEVVSGASLGKKQGSIPYLNLGKAARVTTGAPLPPGADAVIPVEQTVILAESSDGETELRIRCKETVTPGNYVRQEGSDVKERDVVVEAGTKLDHTSIGMLPAVNVCNIRVHRLPVVAVLSVGAELVEPDTPYLQDGQTRDTNRITLLTVIRKLGIKTLDCGIVNDGPRDFIEAVTRAYKQADVVITTGGCSIGDNDYVKALISEIGATLQFGRVAIKPGAPTAFATLETPLGKKLFFALPGVPSPALVAYYVLVSPCLRKLSGVKNPSSTIIKVKLSADVYLSDVPEYQRAILRWDETDPVAYAEVTGRQVISRFLSMVSANALLILPPRSDTISVVKRGSVVNAMIVGKV
uniref:molybdopterin adenylyltransferase n=1 Tax=Phallusia mammillata TaxID=59560 RepID=A0A6F9DEL2_9ASCI|nr:gephyrin [Phallusia mammillata]